MDKSRLYDRNLKKKAQTSVEFAALVAFAMLMLIILLAVFQENVDNIQREQDWKKVSEVYNIISTEIILARTTYANYSREFYLPAEIQGTPITIDCPYDSEINISFNDKKYVFFFNETITGCDDEVDAGKYVKIKKMDMPGFENVRDSLVFGDKNIRR